MLDRNSILSTNFGHPVVCGFLGGHDTMTKSSNNYIDYHRLYLFVGHLHNQEKHDHKKMKINNTTYKQIMSPSNAEDIPHPFA